MKKLVPFVLILFFACGKSSSDPGNTDTLPKVVITYSHKGYVGSCGCDAYTLTGHVSSPASIIIKQVDLYGTRLIFSVYSPGSRDFNIPAANPGTYHFNLIDSLGKVYVGDNFTLQ